MTQSLALCFTNVQNCTISWKQWAWENIRAQQFIHVLHRFQPMDKPHCKWTHGSYDCKTPTIKKIWKKKFISHRSWKAHDTWGHTVRSYEDRWRSCGERETGSLLFLGSMVEPRGYSFRIYVIIKQSIFYDNSLPLSIYKCSCLFVIPDQDWIYKWVRRKKMILHHVCMNSLQWLLSKASLKIRHIFPGKQTANNKANPGW